MERLLNFSNSMRLLENVGGLMQVCVRCESFFFGEARSFFLSS